MEKILKYSVIAIVGVFILALVIQLITGLSYRGYPYPYGYANAPYGMGPWMMGYGGMMGGYGGMGFGMLGGTIFLIIFIVIIVALLEQTGTRTRERTVDALELLSKRYASGEITKDEYLQMKKDLG